MTKDFLVPSISWDSSCFPKNIARASPAPLLHPWARSTSSLSTFQTSSWLGWAAAVPRRQEKSWRWTCSPWQDVISTTACSSLRAIWWSSCHSRLRVIHFLCPIPEVASAEIHWKITLGWKPMQIYVFGFFFFHLWAAFDLKSSFLSWLRCWSRDQVLAVGSCWLAPGRTFGPNSAHVLGSCLFKIHLMLSSPWKLPLREVLSWFIFSSMVIHNFLGVNLFWQEVMQDGSSVSQKQQDRDAPHIQGWSGQSL